MAYSLSMSEEHRPDSVGRRIGDLMRAKGLGPKDLEGPSGLDRGTIVKLVRGERSSTSLEAGLRIARFLGVDPFSLLPGEVPADVQETAPGESPSPGLPPGLHRWLQEAEDWMSDNRNMILQNQKLCQEAHDLALEAKETARSVKRQVERLGRKIS